MSYVCATSYRRLDEAKTYLTEDGEEEEGEEEEEEKELHFKGGGLPRRGKAAPKMSKILIMQNLTILDKYKYVISVMKKYFHT